MPACFMYTAPFFDRNIDSKWKRLFNRSKSKITGTGPGRKGCFAPQGKDPYCDAIPPPNVTGCLHMGHGFRMPLWMP